jgi:hypothetical protein
LFAPNQYPVRLTPEQRRSLGEITRNGHAPVKKIRHAQVLLLSDRDRRDGYRTDADIAATLGMHVHTVARVRKAFVTLGARPALERKPRAAPPVPPKIDGRVEAHLIATCCAPPPEGRARWTLQLLADDLAGRGLVTSVSVETVRRALHRNELKPWRKKTWCIPERDRARFVAQMEQVLDVYAAPPDPAVPLLCMDEASKQLTADVAEPIPASPGHVAKEDHHYERCGVQAIFMFFDPARGWRRVSCRDSRTRVDWAEEVRRLLEEDYPDAPRVRLVCDNLNTHHIASLYAAFPAEQAHRLARRLELVHTPRHGSWLNVAEIELSVLSRQCLDRRIGSPGELAGECAAWQRSRNADGSRVVWRFTTKDARVKLRHLYPQI